MCLCRDGRSRGIRVKRVSRLLGLSRVGLNTVVGGERGLIVLVGMRQADHRSKEVFRLFRRMRLIKVWYLFNRDCTRGFPKES